MLVVMARRPIPKSECRLLSRADARRYCGGLGDERFDREVGPHVAPRIVGAERFYDRLELDAWVDRLEAKDEPAKIDWLARVDDHLDGPHQIDAKIPKTRPARGIEFRYGPREMLEKFGLVAEEDFAAMLGVEVKTLRNRPRSDLPAFVRVGGRRLYEEASVREYLARRRVNSGQ